MRKYIIILSHIDTCEIAHMLITMANKHQEKKNHLTRIVQRWGWFFDPFSTSTLERMVVWRAIWVQTPSQECATGGTKKLIFPRELQKLLSLYCLEKCSVDIFESGREKGFLLPR